MYYLGDCFIRISRLCMFIGDYLLFYNSLIFRTIILIFGNGYLPCLFHLHSNFQLVAPSSLCDSSVNSQFLKCAKLITWFYQGWIKLHTSFVSYVINFLPPKCTLLMFNTATYRFSACSLKGFTLYAYQSSTLFYA